MIQFIKAAFKITPFQIAIFGVLGLLKFLINQAGVIERIEDWFVLIFVGAALLFIAGIGAMAHIERRGQSFQDWEITTETSFGGRLMSVFVTWSRLIPAALAICSFLYLLAPTSIEMAVILYVGLVIGNIIAFLGKGQSPAQ